MVKAWTASDSQTLINLSSAAVTRHFDSTTGIFGKSLIGRQNELCRSYVWQRSIELKI